MQDTDHVGERTCGTCRFRGEAIEAPDEDYNYVPTSYFLCDRIKHFGMKSGLARGEKLDGAGVADGSGYFAALCVANDFGCNRWEPKNEE
jgi:hypothetical protein